MKIKMIYAGNESLGLIEQTARSSNEREEAAAGEEWNVDLKIQQLRRPNFLLF